MSFAVSSATLIDYFPEMYYTMEKVVSEPVFWFAALFVAVVVVSFDYIYIYVRRMYFPKLKHMVQEKRQTHPGTRKGDPTVSI